MSLSTIPAILSAVLFAGSAGAVATTVAADRTEHAERGPRSGKPGAKDGKGHGLCAAVECTDAQKAQLKKIHEAGKAAHAGDREKMKALNAALAAEFRKDKPSQATLQKVFGDMEAMRAAHGKERLEALGKIHDVLTPEQRAVLADRMEKRGMKAMSSKGQRKHGKRDGKGDGKGKPGKGKPKAKPGKAKVKPAAK
jgi:Spy/CpxP family protein refolding chaperone